MENQYEPISPENRAMLAAQMRKLANHCTMSAYPATRKLADNPTSTFERNRDFIKSGVPWLVIEGMAWAAANQSWVELICDEEGTPIDLEVYF